MFCIHFSYESSLANPPFFRLFAQYCSQRTKLFDKSTLIKLKSVLEPPMTTILGKDSQESGLTLEVRHFILTGDGCSEYHLVLYRI